MSKKYDDQQLNVLCRYILREELSNSDKEILKTINDGYVQEAIQSVSKINEGERYTQTLNEYVTRYIFEHIFSNGTEVQKTNALQSLKLHKEYYAQIANPLPYLDDIYEEYSQR